MRWGRGWLCWQGCEACALRRGGGGVVIVVGGGASMRGGRRSLRTYWVGAWLVGWSCL